MLLPFEGRRTAQTVPARPPTGPPAARAPGSMGRGAAGTGLKDGWQDRVSWWWSGLIGPDMIWAVRLTAADTRLMTYFLTSGPAFSQTTYHIHHCQTLWTRVSVGHIKGIRSDRRNLSRVDYSWHLSAHTCIYGDFPKSWKKVITLDK